VILEAAANTSELASSSSGSSVGGGVTLAFGGQQSGLSFQLNASRSQGRADGKETVWDNTQITASDKLSVTSGRDTTLTGAQVSGGTVLFDVGGKLLIETLQDSSKYDSTQSSSGFSVSTSAIGVSVISILPDKVFSYSLAAEDRITLAAIALEVLPLSTGAARLC